MTPEVCRQFEACNANLCPLDPGLADCIWYADESVCKSRIHGKHRWIRKQRSIQRRKTKSWLEKPVTYRMLFDASRKRVLKTEAHEID